MRGSPLESARQVALQLLQMIQSDDERNGFKTTCFAWTFSDEPLLIAAEVEAGVLLNLPLRSGGASMLGRALSAAVASTEYLLERHRFEHPSRRAVQPTISTLVIGDFQPSDEWLAPAVRLAKLGRLTLFATVNKLLPEHQALLSTFHAVCYCQELTLVDLSESLRSR